MVAVAPLLMVALTFRVPAVVAVAVFPDTLPVAVPPGINDQVIGVFFAVASLGATVPVRVSGVLTVPVVEVTVMPVTATKAGLAGLTIIGKSCV